MLIIAMLFIIVPFSFWYGTWFGRKLSDKDINEYLSDTRSARKTQHALTQLYERMGQGERLEQWYPKIVALAGDATPQVRMTAAWVMGQDSSSQEFHHVLLSLLSDAHPLVRANSALALARFGDPAGRPELVKMLRPYTIRAEQAGNFSMALQDEEPVAVEKMVARIKLANGETFEVHSPLGGYVKSILAKEGAKVAVGDELMQVSPEPLQVWEALRALYIVGQPDDLPDVETYTRAIANMNEQIHRQAAITAGAIQQRHENHSQ
jgi:acetyl/propionyl-CoA carboxylase alpha subunit